MHRPNDPEKNVSSYLRISQNDKILCVIGKVLYEYLGTLEHITLVWHSFSFR